MESAFGIVGKDFVMLMTDMTAGRSIIVYQQCDDKIYQLDQTKLMATVGDYASRTSFADFIQKNMNLMRLRTDLDMSNEACAHFIRRQLAKSLRSKGGAVQCNALLGGVDSHGPALYFIDYLGALQKVEYGAHGYCSNFALSIMDKQYRQNLSQDEAKEILKACAQQLQARFIINLPKFLIKTVTAEGTKEEVLEL